jgi:hypothetical protein
MAPDLVKRCLANRQPILYIKSQYICCLICNKSCKTPYGIKQFFDGYTVGHKECIKSFDKVKMYYEPLEIEADKFEVPAAPVVLHAPASPEPSSTLRLVPEKAVAQSNLDFCLKQKIPLLFGKEFVVCLICGDGCNETSEAPTLDEFKANYKSHHAACIANFDTVSHIYEHRDKPMNVISQDVAVQTTGTSSEAIVSNSAAATNLEKIADLEKQIAALKAANAALSKDYDKADDQANKYYERIEKQEEVIAKQQDAFKRVVENVRLNSTTETFEPLRTAITEAEYEINEIDTLIAELDE